MKKLTSKMSKSFLLFQRALVLLGFAVCSLSAIAGTPYYANLTIKEYTSTDSPTGSGKVYVKYYYQRNYTAQDAASFNYDSNVDEVNLTGGKVRSGNVPFYLAVHPISTNSIFAGWYKNDSPINLTEGANYEPTIDTGVSDVLYYTFNINAQSTDADNPTPDMLQAHFGRKVHIMSYDGEGDAWVDNISTDDPDRYAYSENINSPQFSLLYNLVLHSKLSDETITLKANDNSPFNLSLEAGPNDAEGRKTWRLTVTPKGVAESYVDNVVFQIDGADVVTLALNLSRKPITVTLNPAEDLTGRYTYTQNTAPTDEFVVTTSAVVKQMITATDYSFTFYPTPEDPSKYQFEKWVIKNAEGEIIEESITPDLSYRFSGGESITPVFTTFDRAVFIVKSEPAIQYTDLQQALDRAAALTTTTGKNQTVVVTVDAEGKRKGGRLVQGTYTITNGVTFLIPGEKSYVEMKGDLNDDHFQEEGNDHNAFCTLSVDDDTEIIVKNGGSISLYAKLVRTTTYTNGYITFNYGHMILGRNCQINVENGGQLHAFGFITGDPSSHVTMESGSLIYEPFTMTDWRGGSETSSKWVLGSAGKSARVFPIGQYYVQSVEVPLTFKAGAREKLSCSVDAGVTATVNLDYISNYSDTEGFFGLGEGTSLTRTYNPSTDRVKYAFNGTGTSSKVKLGCMNLKLRVAIFNIDVNSKDFVMPIQNNIDIDVKNTTIDVEYDVACLPASTMRVHDDAIINVKNNVYIYDRGARRFAKDANDAVGSGYWMSQNKVIVPLNAKARPGGILYGHTNAAGKFTAGRTEEDLVDASWIINGDMNIHGALYTVCGNFAEADDKDPNAQGGADISSEGSGKINVYNIVPKATVNQWDQANAVGAVTIPITEYLLLHNDLSKGATAAYTPVKNENNQNLSSNPLSYTYYQYDGTWRLPIAGITGIKLYDAEDHEITNFYVTLPNDIVTGYLLATLEPIIEYDVNNFDIQLSAGNIAIVNDDNNKPAIVNDGKQLKIPVVYTPKNIHGEHSQTLTITNTPDAGFDCNLEETLLAIEDYNPIFEAPTTMNIYGRVSEDNPATLLIKPADKNITTLSEVNSNMVWTYEITSTNDDKEQFDFKFGEGDGNKLAGAQVIFTPNSVGEKKAKLILTATYKDADNPQKELTKVHNVELVGNGLIIDNTMEFNNVGTITTSTTDAFNLLCNVNSTGTLKFYIVDGTTETLVPNDATYTSNEIIDIQYTTIDGKGNYWITPKHKIGQVTVKVSQERTTSHSAKTITTTIVVVGDPKPLEGKVCLDDNTFETLTEDLDFVEYDATLKRLNFVGDGSSSTWTAQFASAPGVLTFTPNGDGYWAVQESMDGVNWSEIIWWTQLPAEKEVYVTLSPRTRRVKISYRKINEIGSITSLCISPFSVYAETTKSYVPVKDGSILPTSIVFTHATPDVEVSITPKNAAQLTITNLSEPTLSKSTSDNLGGVLNTFYQTTVTLSGGANIPELNDAFNLIAKQGDDEAVVVLATYDFPKPLPMESNTWVSDGDATNNTNGYDEAEYYNHYMVSSKNVKWDAANQAVVFMNKGSHAAANRQVSFGYYGLPSELRFESHSTDWLIDEGVETTEGIAWTPSNVDLRTIDTKNGINTITQPINHTSKFVRITYVGTETNEVTIKNIIIEGFPNATAPAEVEIAKANDQATPSATFDIHVMNLPRMQLVLDNTSEFRMLHGDVSNWTSLTNTDVISTSNYPTKMKMNEEGNITIKVEWIGTNLVNEGYIKIINPDQNNEVMATVRIVGKKDAITLAEASTGIWTGVPDGKAEGRPTANAYTLEGATGTNKVFDSYTYHEVNIKNAFDATTGSALFNYVVIYGETTTKDGSRTITRPTGSAGSNAKTPYYIYERSEDGMSYRFVQAIEDANTPNKADLSKITHFTEFVVDQVKYYAIQPKDGKPLSFYMTGFCPYATTGSTKDDEGVWYFRGEVNDQVHIYLEDCHLYSRTKSQSGHYTSKNGDDSPFFNDAVVKGSGAVLVFENANPQQNNVNAFNVAIHTRGHNILKSNFGCYYNFLFDAQATQISSPVQVRLGAANHFQTAKTILDFDDVWPFSKTLSDHTNGFLSLQKQANNAPSIDLGNAHTVVNFRGGQIQLQNAQIGSPNYKTTLAISYRSGLMTNLHIPMAYGIGTDEVGGTVNFYDGTTTVLPMKVDEAYRSFYLMDTVVLKNQQGNDSVVELATTSCLRTPTKTYVYGGSHCMMRACNHVTSKGGAPKDGPTGVLLGRYVYNNTNPEQGYTYRCVVDELPTGDLSIYQAGYELVYQNNRYVVDLTNNEWDSIGPAPFTDPCYIVTPTNFPGNLQYKGSSLATYYQSYPDGEYGLNSVTPDGNGNLSFWVPGGVVPGVTPEEDKNITGWKACMTEIEAGAFGITGRIGGDVSVEFNEEVTNLLYCQLDDNIYNVISDRTATGVDSLGNITYSYNYKAPVVDPSGQLPDSMKYQYLPPTHVGDSAQYRVFSEEDYMVTNYLYYITTAQADKWMNFTMPFDVDTIWVVEAYSETEIVNYFSNPTDKKQGESNMQATLRYQAKHNADFAAFFGVAMAIGDDKRSFEDIFRSYINWARNKADVENGLYTSGTYNLRGKYPLTHYDGTNFQSSNFYLYHNKNTWYQTESDQFDTQWEIVPAKQNGQPLMRAGETYSLLFPYCLGCDVQLNDTNGIVLDDFGLPKLKERDYWDYWSGKFLIFQSTKASQSSPHIIKGSNYIAPNKVEDNPWLFDKHPTDPTQAVLTGNSTFMLMDVNEYANADQVYEYISDTYYESYLPLEKDNDTKKYPTLTPTTTFLLKGSAARAKMITREGKIIYDANPDGSGDENQGTTTGGNIPTVGGGNDLFITSTVEGINIAVAEPQQVRVMSATGAIIYSGLVQTAVDVALPATGVYVVAGENEVHKILH